MLDTYTSVIYLILSIVLLRCGCVCINIFEDFFGGKKKDFVPELEINLTEVALCAFSIFLMNASFFRTRFFNIS